MGRPKTPKVVDQDPLVGSADIAKRLSVTVEYARQLMTGGEFGDLYAVGRGEIRTAWRVRRSAVDTWIESRKRVVA